MRKKCTKLVLKTQGIARNAAKKMAFKNNVPFDFYFCERCKGWHVGRSYKTQLSIMKKKILKENDAVLGIDPGKTGSLALICGAYLEIHDFKSILAAKRLIAGLNHKFLIKFCVLEKVWLRPKERDVKRAEKLIRNSQIWETLLILNGIDYEKYSPDTWRKGLIPLSGDKERFVKKAIKLFPYYEKEFSRHDRAEATLMAYRAWRHIEAGKDTRIKVLK